MRTVAVLFLVWKSLEGLHSSHKLDGTKPDGECSNGEQGCLYGKKLNREKSKKTTGKDGADMEKGLGIDESQDNAKNEGEKAEDKGDNNMEENGTMWFAAFFVLGVGATGALFRYLAGFGGKTITKEEHETLLLPGAYAAGLCGVHETSSKAGDKDNNIPSVILNPNAEPECGGLVDSTPTPKQLIFFVSIGFWSTLIAFFLDAIINVIRMTKPLVNLKEVLAYLCGAAFFITVGHFVVQNGVTIEKIAGGSPVDRALYSPFHATEMSVASAKVPPSALPSGAAIRMPDAVVVSSFEAQSGNPVRDNSIPAPIAQLGDGTGMYAAPAQTAPGTGMRADLGPAGMPSSVPPPPNPGRGW